MRAKTEPAQQICVYGGASSNAPQSHLDAAYALGQGIAQAGYGLLFGGGSLGIMGAVCDGALDAGGYVTGVITDFLKSEERVHKNLDRLLVVETMRQRKLGLFEQADAIVVAPGGLGTLDEFLEVLTLKQLGQHDKSLLIADVAGYWQPLLALITHLDETGYLHHRHRDLFEVCDSSDALLSRIRQLLPAA